ncbi:hypothetical protein [Streptomyces sp. NPDC005423]|uniref:hypothetical protein n=1 Tax=Streptomyces sp. NPDC005423 TaxID=3155343 RepID=UPI0033B6D614
MPADEVTHGTEVDESRVRTGPRHAAPKKPLFTRFHMPAGKAIATVAMPTAVLVGLGFTSSFALADNGGSTPSAKSLTADEYKDCVSALASGDASASPSPSASASGDSSKDDATPSATASDSAGSGSGKASSSDSGSDDKATATPTPSATASASKSTATKSSTGSSGSSSGATATATPSASASSGNLLDTIGGAITGILSGGSGSSGSSGSSSSGSTASATPTPTASASASASAGSSSNGSGSTKGTVKDTTQKVTDTVKNTVGDATGTASKAAGDTSKAVEKAAGAATASPSPSASSTTDASDCPVATDDTSGVDNTTALPDDPWYLDASSLLLKGADYQGVVEVKTADGSVKKVLKYVISGGTDIGDLHQTVHDKQSGKTYNVQAAAGSTSTIRDGETVMYTQSISGNLFGLIPITFDPDNPPPLNIPLIYFTNAKVVQAGQFGGTLTIPGLHNYVSD